MTCKDCLHYESCKVFNGIKVWATQNSAEECICFTSRSEWVKLPCKVDDTVFVIPTKENGRKEITKMEVSGFALGKPYNNVNMFDDKNKLYQPSFELFGKTVFFTREEAEKALKEG